MKMAKTVKPSTHWRQSWIQHGQLCWKSTVDRVAFGGKVDRVGNNVNCDKLSNSSCRRFVAKTGDKVDRIGDKVHCIDKVDFGSSVYRA